MSVAQSLRQVWEALFRVISGDTLSISESPVSHWVPFFPNPFSLFFMSFVLFLRAALKKHLFFRHY